MKIRTYLTIVILLCLIGTYVTEYSISKQRQNLQSLTQQHHLKEYAANEFGHIKHNISQFLITADLILASGETYLFPGAIEQAELLLSHLDDLNKTSSLPGNRELLLEVRQSVDDISQTLLKAAADGSTVNSSGELNFLEIYDESSITLVKNLADVSSQMSEEIESETRHLSSLSREAVEFQRIVIIGFSMLVFLLWYWTIRQISKPVQELSAMAVKVRDTRTFVGVGYGPQEIQTLSHEISSLTNSLLYQANHDPLTKLNNRREFERQLKQTLNSSRRGDNSLANTLCYIDLDRFKIVNDTCGHSAGDELLTRVAGILISNARQNDIVARVGGDEFTILLTDCDIESAIALTQRLLHKIEDIRYIHEDNEFRISASIGLTAISGNEIDLQEIVNAADAACKMAKDSGRNQVQILDIEDERVKRSRQDLLQLNQILNAIDESRFLLYFQSIVPLQQKGNTAKLIEVQVRMDTDDGEILSHEEFNPLIQQYHLKSHLDKWMLREIARLFYNNPHEFESIDLCMLQISDESLRDESFRNYVDELLQENPLLGKILCFEINESAANSSFELTSSFIEKLKKHHVRFALDEFGISHSSSDHLDSLNVDYLKINGALVKDLINSPCDMATVKSIVDVGIRSEKAIIAEMVESEKTAEYLTDIGVAYAQGDLYTKAAPLSANKSKDEIVASEKNSIIEPDFQQELDQAV